MGKTIIALLVLTTFIYVAECQPGFKIKYAAGILALIGLPGAEPRYRQLTNMMSHYNSEFDERKYWTYGCNCLILGDRPMSDPSQGPPVDALDTVCKAYKDCQRCVRANYGDNCIGEIVKYRFGFTKKGDAICKDTTNSCSRALCECDRAFAENHASKAHIFNSDYHVFWSKNPNGWEPTSSCPKRGGGPYDPQCCRKGDGPYALYNAKTRTCCDGEVKTGSC